MTCWRGASKRSIETSPPTPIWPAQVIGRFLILPKALDADDGELTRMRKIRRAVIAERYAALIEGLYSGRDRARISMRISFDDGRASLLDVNVPIRALGKPVVAR